MKLWAVGSGETTGSGEEQPRQRRDAPGPPDGAGLARETGRWTRGTSDVKLLTVASNDDEGVTFGDDVKSPRVHVRA